MAETITVFAIVGGVLVLAGRSFYRTLTGKNEGCGCGAKTCPGSRGCRLSEVQIEGKKKHI